MGSVLGRFIFIIEAPPIIQPPDVCPLLGPSWEAKWLWMGTDPNWCKWKIETVWVINPNTTVITEIDFLDLTVEVN